MPAADDRVAPPARIETIEAIFAAFARREHGVAFAAYDDQIVWDTRALAGSDLDGVFHGHEGVRAWWRLWLAAWDEIAVVDGPSHEANGNQVVSCWRQTNRGRSSGATVQMEVGIVWTFEGDRIVRVAVFPTQAEARRAAGLPA